MQKRSEDAFSIVDLAIEIIVDAAKEYRRQWRMYLGALILGWWSLIVVEVVLIAIMGTPVLIRVEPLLFRLSSNSSFDFVSSITRSSSSVWYGSWALFKPDWCCSSHRHNDLPGPA